MAAEMSEEGTDTETINVVPLADLSLVLLIILMVLSPMVMSSMIRVQAPRLEKVKQRHKDPAKTPDPILIKVTAQGVFLNNNPIDSDQFLSEQIAIKIADDADRPVIVSAEDQIQVGDVVKYLDLAKQSGANKVSLLKAGAES
jgi:biopolymer transport protein ExbD